MTLASSSLSWEQGECKNIHSPAIPAPLASRSWGKGEEDFTPSKSGPSPLASRSLDLDLLLSPGLLTPGSVLRCAHLDVFSEPRETNEGGGFSRMGVRESQSLPLPQTSQSLGEVSPQVLRSSAASPLTPFTIIEPCGWGATCALGRRGSFLLSAIPTSSPASPKFSIPSFLSSCQKLHDAFVRAGARGRKSPQITMTHGLMKGVNGRAS